jgi:hypothetical protein
MLDVGVLMTMDMDHLRLIPLRAEWLSNANEGVWRLPTVAIRDRVAPSTDTNPGARRNSSVPWRAAQNGIAQR